MKTLLITAFTLLTTLGICSDWNVFQYNHQIVVRNVDGKSAIEVLVPKQEDQISIKIYDQQNNIVWADESRSGEYKKRLDLSFMNRGGFYIKIETKYWLLEQPFQILRDQVFIAEEDRVWVKLPEIIQEEDQKVTILCEENGNGMRFSTVVSVRDEQGEELYYKKMGRDCVNLSLDFNHLPRGQYTLMISKNKKVSYHFIEI